MTAATTGAPTPRRGTRLKLSASRKTATWLPLPRRQSTNMCGKDLTAGAFASHGSVETTLMRRALGSGQTAVLLNSHSGIMEMRTACTTGFLESGMMELVLPPRSHPSYAARRGNTKHGFIMRKASISFNFTTMFKI